MKKNFLQRSRHSARSLETVRCFGLCISSVIMRELQHRLHPFAKEEFEDFLNMIKASGDSSFKYLQNVYTNRDVQNQAVSIALAVSENVLGNHGVCRVHGGGFAGTIQAFVKNDFVEEYRKALDAVFGEGSCHVLKVRKYGGMKVIA